MELTKRQQNESFPLKQDPALQGAQSSAVVQGINHIFAQAFACHTEEELGGLCLRVAEELTGSKFGFIGELSAEGRLNDIAISDPGWDACKMPKPVGHRHSMLPSSLPIHGIYGRVLLEGRAFFTNEPCSHPDAIGTPPGHPQLTAFLGAPLIQHGKTIGMVAVANRDGGYRPEDLAALEAIGGPIVQVLMRRRAEEALKRSEARFRLLSELAGSLLTTRSPQALVNKLCTDVMQHLDCQMFFNYLLDEHTKRLRLNACVGISSEQMRHIEWLEQGAAVCGCVARDRERLIAEDIQHSDDPRTLLVKSYGVQAYCCHPLLADGRLIGTLSFGTKTRARFRADEIALMQTVTDQVAVAMERMLNQQVLEESQARLKRAQEIAHLGSWELDLLKNELIWSEEVYRIFGIAPETFEPSYEAFLDRVHPEDAAAVNAAYIRSIEQGSSAYEIEHRVINKSTGEIRWVLEKCQHVRDENGAIVRSSGMVHDITERKQAEQALKDADRKKDEFLAMLAHELRNPMAAISSALSVLSLRSVREELAKSAKDVLHRRIRQLSRLVDDLLDVSRIARGKIVLRKQSFDLTLPIQGAVESTRAACEERRHELTVNVLSKLPVHADPVRIEQIIANVLSNAAKYTELGGRISLTAFRRGNSAVISVKDNGIGMEAALLPKIFELFGQADDSFHRASGGLGVGLSVVKQLVEMHGGTVAAHSDGPGKGSEFTICLPIHEHVDSLERSDRSAPAVTGLKILIVEDHEDTALMTAALLRHDRHHVEVALDGHSALRLALKHRPDVILLDLGLPGKNGFEVAGELRENGLNECKIIAATGYGQERDIERAKAAGIDHHLLKPIDPAKLAAILAEARTAESESSSAPPAELTAEPA